MESDNRLRELAEEIQTITLFLEGLWTSTEPRSYMRTVIEGIHRARGVAQSIPNATAAMEADIALNRVRVIIGRDRDADWCDSREEVAAMVKERMTAAYEKCGKDLERITAVLLAAEPTPPATPLPPPPRLTVTISAEHCQAVLDGNAYPLTLDQATLLQALLDAGGDWVSAGKVVSKPERVIEKLPEALRAAVESARPKGTRIRL